jgi:hypothetical protein
MADRIVLTNSIQHQVDGDREWYTDIMIKLFEFAKLGDKWNISDATLVTATQFLNALLSVELPSKPRVFPDPSGEISFEWDGLVVSINELGNVEKWWNGEEASVEDFPKVAEEICAFLRTGRFCPA